MRSVDLSIVVPIYNEVDNIEPLHAAIVGTLAETKLDYELILVDDGSQDDSFARASQIAHSDSRVKVVAFRRNFGQTAAIAAGIRKARGRIIVTMDGDLQNDPVDIPRMLALLDSGYHIVVGWRRNRRDEGTRVFVSRVANKIMALVLGVAVRDSGCSLKAYRAELIQGLPLYGEMHRFIPALSQLAGGRLAQIEVKHHPRLHGVSKYGFSRIYKVLLDIVSIRFLLSYARRPLLWHGKFTGIVFLCALLLPVSSLMFGKGGTLIIDSGIAVLLLSLGLIMVQWGVIGQLVASGRGNVTRYATLAADLAVRVNSLQQPERQV